MESPSIFVSIKQSISRKRLSLFLAAMFFIGLGALLAADFWEKKDYGQWTIEECRKMKEDSPWSFKYLLEGRGIASDGQVPFVKYNVQILSALPIRLAMVREAQIASKFDSFTDEKKKAFNMQMGPLMDDAAYQDRIIVTLSYSTNLIQQEQEIVRYWQSKTKELLLNTTYLYASKGKKAQLIDYKAGQGGRREIQFVFPREMDGKPLATNLDKNLTLEFEYPVIQSIGDGRGRVEFNVKKMLIGGELKY